MTATRQIGHEVAWQRQVYKTAADLMNIVPVRSGRWRSGRSTEGLTSSAIVAAHRGQANFPTVDKMKV